MIGRASRSLTQLAATVLLVAAVAACGKKQPPVAPPPPPPPPAPVAAPPPPPPPAPKPQPPPPAPAPRQPTEAEIFARLTLEEINAQKPLDVVYFDYDKADLTESARAALQKNAEWMRKWSATRVTVEGHADSRGTTEYNLALGERRAAAARDYLVSLGISTERIAIVSKGEEEPTCRDEVESCWSLNRRGFFIVTAK
jgi:peptidoglycan-associated lipoprotein